MSNTYRGNAMVGYILSKKIIGSCKTTAWYFILFENLFKPRQLRFAVYMLLTSSVLSTTSKQCFEQPAASFLVCSLIFIEYKKGLFKKYM